jgi:membrane-bound serine protease (ClpP class)
MKRTYAFLALILGAGLVLGGLSSATEKPPAGYIHLIRINGLIAGATAELVEEARTQAESFGATAVLIELDTPGGIVDSTREIVKSELNSKVPVIVFVGPRGARAGSAGVFITLAGHIAAMAPSTNIGAAHPIRIGAPDIVPEMPDEPEIPDGSQKKDKAEKGDEKKEDKFRFRPDSEHLAKKIENDTVAWIEAIAKERGRNVEWARDAVINSVSITADEALKLGVIDLIADDREALLKEVHDREVRTAAGPQILKTLGAPVIEQEMTRMQRFQLFLSNPSVLGLLGLLMMVGFYIELNNPGLIFPAVVGVLALIGLLVGSQLVPVNIVGFLLIALGFILFFLEVKIVSFGLLTLGGFASIIAGFYLLADKTTFSAPAIDWRLVAPVMIPTLALVAVVIWLAAKTQLTKRAADLSDMVGQVGEVTMALDPDGKVFVLGTYWTATSTVPLEKGQKARVVSVDGLRLNVEPADKAGKEGA